MNTGVEMGEGVRSCILSISDKMYGKAVLSRAKVNSQWRKRTRACTIGTIASWYVLKVTLTEAGVKNTPSFHEFVLCS